MALPKFHCRSFPLLRNVFSLCSSSRKEDCSISAFFLKRLSFNSSSRHLPSRRMVEVCRYHELFPSFGKGYTFRFSRSMATLKTKVDRKKRDLARREFQLLRRKTKLMKASMSPEERLLWRLKKANRKRAVLLQRLKKYELEEDPVPVHDPELITPEQLQALKKIGYKNRNYVPVGRRGVYGGVVQNMHMHWKFHETVQVDCHIFKREDMRTVAKQLAVLSGGIVIDIHQKTTIIMYRGRNYKQPKTEMIPKNTLTKRKALFKSKFLQALDMIDENIKNIEGELQTMRRKQKQNISQETEVNNVDQFSRNEYTEISSDDDGGFSWESDSLDEDELSESEKVGYERATSNGSEEENKVKPISWTLGPAMQNYKKRPQVAKELVKAEQQLFIHGHKKAEETPTECIGEKLESQESGNYSGYEGSSYNTSRAELMVNADRVSADLHNKDDNNNPDLSVRPTHTPVTNEKIAELLSEPDGDEIASDCEADDEFGTDFDDLCDDFDSKGVNHKIDHLQR